ncbi:Fatty acid/sphingolipid desaturase [Metarhizium rileyi]|uniref:Delta 8-(E)-sphingolipid desaturase n=1 Tax=Metarhizium rileyi (strain RCEF 4871) TaxID=1649241 RepID=A0A162M2H3_METRR|nr:Fatty acid/sphingolipid desaturase [Metarhizium rileyi RCEF 4871]
MDSTSTPSSARTYPYMSRNEIESRIASGQKIVIFSQHVLKVDPWLPYHPGGEKALLHMVGKDATDEIQALHSKDAQERMLRYRIGKIDGFWTNFRPPIQGGAFRPTLNNGHFDHEEPVHQKVPASIIPNSGTLSPVFDNDNEIWRRRRHDKDSPSRTASISSKSSVETDTTGLSYLDALTREQISLDLDKYPDVDLATQHKIAAKYRGLHKRIVDEGLYECSQAAYVVECCRYLALFAAMLISLSHEYYVLGAVCLGLAWHQLVFLAHDAGHMGITHDYQIDTAIGILVADFIGGLSLGWWKRNHNVHHIVTNAPEHDPDIEHVPLFAVTHRLLGSLRSTYYDRVMEYDAVAEFMLKIQAWTYYPLLALGRFNLYRLSWDYLIARRGPRRGPGAWHWYLEIAGQLFFWAWFGYGILCKTLPDGWTRLMFIMVSHITSSPLHVQIVLSHFAMSTSDLGPQESFAQRMLRTTMDIDCPPWLDFIHGGLQFQAIHHLFPRMPRHNLRRAQSLVVEFCREVGIPYALYGFSDGNKAVLGRLAEVSRQAAILAKCQETIARNGGVFGHHD